MKDASNGIRPVLSHKLLDVSKASALGWTSRTELEDGIKLVHQDFLSNPMWVKR